MARLMSKIEAVRVLQRVGLNEEQIHQLLDKLDDPIDLDRDGPILHEHGITRDHLRDLMGGSP